MNFFFQTIGQGPALPAVSHTKLEFINGAPCPVSIDRQSFFMVDLKYGEVCSMNVLFFLLMRMALAQYQSCLSILLILYIDILLVNDEISSFISRVTFSFNNGVTAPDTFLSALRQSKYSLVRCYGDILLSLLFCEQII